MPEDTKPTAAQVAEPSPMAKIQCITDLRPHATIDGSGEPQPLELDRVAMIPRAEAEIMKRNRHVVEIQ